MGRFLGLVVGGLILGAAVADAHAREEEARARYLDSVHQRRTAALLAESTRAARVKEHERREAATRSLDAMARSAPDARWRRAVLRAKSHLQLGEP